MRDFAYYYPPINERDVGRGCYLTSIGSGCHAPGSPYPAAGHPPDYAFAPARGRVFPDFALVRISAGSGWFERRRDQPPEPVRPGDFFCLTPGDWHSYAPDPASGWTEAWVCFNGDYPHRLQRGGELPDQPRLLRPGPGGSFSRRFDGIIEALDSMGGSTTLGSGLRCLALYAEIAASKPGPAEADTLDSDMSGLCREVRKQIRENLHRKVDLDRIAASLGVTRRTLERRFRRECGTSPGRFLIEERVDRAIGLIESTGMPLKAIAYACGFGSPHRMIYDFRRRKGLNPGAFRKPQPGPDPRQTPGPDPGG